MKPEQAKTLTPEAGADQLAAAVVLLYMSAQEALHLLLATAESEPEKREITYQLLSVQAALGQLAALIQLGAPAMPAEIAAALAQRFGLHEGNLGFVVSMAERSAEGMKAIRKGKVVRTEFVTLGAPGVQA